MSYLNFYTATPSIEEACGVLDDGEACVWINAQRTAARQFSRAAEDSLGRSVILDEVELSLPDGRDWAYYLRASGTEGLGDPEVRKRLITDWVNAGGRRAAVKIPT